MPAVILSWDLKDWSCYLSLNVVTPRRSSGPSRVLLNLITVWGDPLGSSHISRD